MAHGVQSEEVGGRGRRGRGALQEHLVVWGVGRVLSAMALRHAGQLVERLARRQLLLEVDHGRRTLPASLLGLPTAGKLWRHTNPSLTSTYVQHAVLEQVLSILELPVVNWAVHFLQCQPSISGSLSRQPLHHNLPRSLGSTVGIHDGTGGSHPPKCTSARQPSANIA